MIRFAFNTITSLALLLACTLGSWTILSKTNFFYAHIYEFNNLALHIAKYAPQNRNKEDFELTTTEEHIRLFGEIAKSVNSDGEGLAKITYRANGKEIDTLLTQAEITHLEDVSHLVTPLKSAGLGVSVALLLFLGICWLYKEKRQRYLWRPMGLFSSIVGLLILVAASTGTVFIVGPQKVFYFLHEVFFKDKGQWFFYFQDSLMTTLMPEVVFANISILIAALTAIIWVVSLILIKSLLD